MTIHAMLYDGKNSREHAVILRFDHDKHLHIPTHGIDYPLTQVVFSSRLGNTPRLIELPNGARCKVADNDKLDAILAQLQITPSRIHTLERSWRLAIGSMVLIMGFVIFMLTAGAGYSATFLATVLPESSLDYASTQALESLDESYLKESNLTQSQKAKILANFQILTGGEARYKLHFRSSKLFGPNAFALPSGDIVLMDQLVALDKESELYGVMGVLAHEKGHVVYKHGIKSLIKGAIATTVIGFITGDLSFVATSLPTMLITSSYSREFESQADSYAKQELQRLHISTKPLASLFKSIGGYHATRENDRNQTIIDYLSTHPSTVDRVKFFETE